jgi:hypothetical protein
MIGPAPIDMAHAKDADVMAATARIIAAKAAMRKGRV